MADIPSWLSDEGIERTEAIGREMLACLEQRRERKAVEPEATLEPPLHLLELLRSSAVKKEDAG